MQEASRCWVCHRALEEIVASVDTETPEEKELKKQMSQVTWFKSKFTESADLWRKSLPRDFKDMDFAFIASNADHFSSIKVLAEILDAKKLMLDWLVDASGKLHAGGDHVKDLAELSDLDDAEKASVLKMLDQFEARYHRSLDGGHGGNLPVGFEGLKLPDGLEFLVAEGLLYYDVRAQLLQLAMAKASAKKPKKSIRMVQANGYPAVPLCSVCESLIMGLRAPESRHGQQAAEHQAKRAAEGEHASKQVQVATVSVMAAEVPSDVSPKVAEIMRNLGPASGEAPRGRNLHEHRLKEDYDDMARQGKGA
jgi:hypothetical protein